MKLEDRTTKVRDEGVFYGVQNFKFACGRNVTLPFNLYLEHSRACVWVGKSV